MPIFDYLLHHNFTRFYRELSQRHLAQFISRVNQKLDYKIHCNCRNPSVQLYYRISSNFYPCDTIRIEFTNALKEKKVEFVFLLIRNYKSMKEAQLQHIKA